MTVCDIIINKLPNVLVSEVFSFVNPVWLSCVNKKYLEMNRNHIISGIINHHSMDDYTIYLIRKNKWFCFGFVCEHYYLYKIAKRNRKQEIRWMKLLETWNKLSIQYGATKTRNVLRTFRESLNI
jgi:predicted SprT family Zn-dependent metalloprotease